MGYELVNFASLTIAGRPDNIPLAGLCGKEFASCFFPTEKLIEIEQALVETINNCVEHAYADSDGAPIKIEFKLLKDRLLIEVTDHGKQFLSNRLVQADSAFDFDPEDIDNLPEGGMGLMIIKSCMDDVSYHRNEGTNFWRLTKLR